MLLLITIWVIFVACTHVFPWIENKAFTKSQIKILDEKDFNATDLFYTESEQALEIYLENTYRVGKK